MTRADCINCPAPLSRHFGRWSHHWIYKNACHDPVIRPGTATEDGKPSRRHRDHMKPSDDAHPTTRTQEVPVTTTDYSCQTHVASICQEAGLEMMAGVFDVLWNRETVNTETLASLTSEDVTELYAGFIGPAIDKIEEQLTWTDEKAHT